MITEIGKSVRRPVFDRKGKQFVRKLDPTTGEPEFKHMPATVWRATRTTLDHSFGCHSGRKLVVGLIPIDVLVLYPYKTRTAKVSLKLSQLYRYGLQCRALIAQLEKARKRKEKLALVRQRRRLDAAEKRLRQPV